MRVGFCLVRCLFTLLIITENLRGDAWACSQAGIADSYQPSNLTLWVPKMVVNWNQLELLLHMLSWWTNYLSGMMRFLKVFIQRSRTLTHSGRMQLAFPNEHLRHETCFGQDRVWTAIWSMRRKRSGFFSAPEWRTYTRVCPMEDQDSSMGTLWEILTLVLSMLPSI